MKKAKRKHKQNWPDSYFEFYIWNISLFKITSQLKYLFQIHILCKPVLWNVRLSNLIKRLTGSEWCWDRCAATQWDRPPECFETGEGLTAATLPIKDMNWGTKHVACFSHHFVANIAIAVLVAARTFSQRPEKVSSFVASRFCQFKLPRGSGKLPDLVTKLPSWQQWPPVCKSVS